MNNAQVGRDPSPRKYTIKLNALADMAGYVVEITDKFNSTDYTLDRVYLEKDTAITDADTFINNLSEKENTLLIN